MNDTQIARSLEGYASVLREATGALDRAAIPHLVFGSIATRALGRPRPISTDEDIDLFVRPPDAPSALRALEDAGFVTVEEDPTWIHKAKRGGVTVDVIFKAAGRVYMDDEMFERGVPTAMMGVELRLVSAEDLAVMKALIHDEARAFDWFDAVALLDQPGIDWDYLIRRAEAFGAQRVLSLMIFAETHGVVVPAAAISTLRDATRG
jgi:predicted nucleotidyltransferase